MLPSSAKSGLKSRAHSIGAVLDGLLLRVASMRQHVSPGTQNVEKGFGTVQAHRQRSRTIGLPSCDGTCFRVGTGQLLTRSDLRTVVGCSQKIYGLRYSTEGVD